ncbi:unnamed protein product [Kluyveromyces dobzhanskii CBS 2104]|uniref:Cysteine synthase 1 n=1 Tax=Kluyveromyces dobzhanskii CBS 2104 TaxID=1427455 RepID=A0A0A8LAP4_9SACH|nr:unnamed protein product [Kluyveromyces dobzhanskii CBS 2104]
MFRFIRRLHVPPLANRGFTDAVGSTPLIKLQKLSKELGRNIYGKSELQNPGGSVKDRAALNLIEDAEKRGLIDPSKPATIVEGSAGNTAIGLAHICKAKGYNAVFYMPDTQSEAKINLLKWLGAEVYPVPVCPISDPLNFNNRARDHAKRLDNAVWTDQFDNQANWKSHYYTTGPEILQQIEADGLQLDAFTCSTGTGGTYTGVAKYLKEATNGKCKLVVADPPGSVVYSYVKTGESIREGSSFTEGIGQGRITENMRQSVEITDDAVFVPDEESIVMLFRLLDEEGLFVGSTSGLNVVAAAKVALTLPEGSNVATILCDSGHKYADRVFSKSWLQSKKLYDVLPDHLKKYASLE